jgi:quercetin dioxygenase-like cupin family protein
MLFEAVDPSHASGGSVTFEPGARTAWHSDPRGQILIVTAGTGRVQRWGDPIEEIRQGDVVRIPAGQKHWHGASPQASMTHIAITEHRDGTAVQWMEKVSDEQYKGAPVSPQPQPSGQQQGTRGPSGPLQQKLAPGLATLTDEVLFGDVWRRPVLSPRRPRSGDRLGPDRDRKAQLAGHLAGRSTTVYGQARPPAFWRTWRFIAAGRARSRRWSARIPGTRKLTRLENIDFVDTLRWLWGYFTLPAIVNGGVTSKLSTTHTSDREE